MTTLNKRPKREDMYWGGPGDLGGYTFTPDELERATAQYHAEQDKEAMAARIDSLLAENDQLKRQVTEMATTAQIKDSYQDSLESAVRRLGGSAYKNVGNMKEEL